MYADFVATYVFKLIAVENLGPLNASAVEFLCNLGQRISTMYTICSKLKQESPAIAVIISRIKIVHI